MVNGELQAVASLTTKATGVAGIRCGIRDIAVPILRGAMPAFWLCELLRVFIFT